MQSPGYYFYADHLASELAAVPWQSPESLERRGDSLARQAVQTMFLTIAAAVAFLVGVVTLVSKGRKAVTTALASLLLVATLGALIILEVAS
jgi:hypothetical protein